jgi:hypothetical protein
MSKFILAIITLLFFSNFLYGQAAVKQRLIKLSDQLASISIVDQQDCPLKIIALEAYVTEDGSRPEIRYDVQNRSKKRVTYFSVAYINKYWIGKWASHGIGGENGIGREDGKGPVLLFPGDKYWNLQSSDFTVVKSSPEVDQLFIRKENTPVLKLFCVAMVTKVIFSDGAVYDRTDTHAELFNLVNREF